MREDQNVSRWRMDGNALNFMRWEVDSVPDIIALVALDSKYAIRLIRSQTVGTESFTRDVESGDGIVCVDLYDKVPKKLVLGRLSRN